MAEDYSYNTGKVKNFSTADYVLFVLTLVISSGIGIFYAIKDRKRNTPKEFLLAGKNMSVIPVALSLTVTFMSALTLLGNPAEIYYYNTMFWWICAGFILAMGFAAHIFIPFFYRLGVTSTMEYVNMRFGAITKYYASIIQLVQLFIYAAFLLYAPSLAISAVTGLNLWGCCIGMGIVVTFYTTLGGMKAVVWTDTFQALVIVAGLLAVLIKGSDVAGGFDKAWDDAKDGKRIKFDEINFDPKVRHSVWSLGIGGWFFWMFLYGVNQAQVQRCLSLPSVGKAQLAIALNLPGLIFITCACSMIGVVMYSFYKDCDPLVYGTIDRADQILPLYVMDILGDYHGVPGIFVSCIVSGSLSSFSSILGAATAVTVKDLIPKKFLEGTSQFKLTLISKAFVIVFGIISMGFAYAVSKMGSVLEAIYTITGVINGPILGVFTLGMFYPWANKYGALSGMTLSLAFLTWVGIGAFVEDIDPTVSSLGFRGCNFSARPPPAPVQPEVEDLEPVHYLYQLSYMWYTVIGMCIVHVVGMIVSLITGKTDPKSLDPRLICPLFEKLFPCLPGKARDFLRCGVNHDGKYDADPIQEKGTAPNGSNMEFHSLGKQDDKNTPPPTGSSNPSYVADNHAGKLHF